MASDKPYFHQAPSPVSAHRSGACQEANHPQLRYSANTATKINRRDCHIMKKSSLPVASAETSAPPVLAIATVHSSDSSWKPICALPCGATPAAWPKAAIPAMNPPRRPGMPCRFCGRAETRRNTATQPKAVHGVVSDGTACLLIGSCCTG